MVEKSSSYPARGALGSTLSAVERSMFTEILVCHVFSLSCYNGIHYRTLLSRTIFSRTQVFTDIIIHAKASSVQVMSVTTIDYVRWCILYWWSQCLRSPYNLFQLNFGPFEFAYLCVSSELHPCEQFPCCMRRGFLYAKTREVLPYTNSQIIFKHYQCQYIQFTFHNWTFHSTLF